MTGGRGSGDDKSGILYDFAGKPKKKESCSNLGGLWPQIDPE